MWRIKDRQGETNEIALEFSVGVLVLLDKLGWLGALQCRRSCSDGPVISAHKHHFYVVMMVRCIDRKWVGPHRQRKRGPFRVA